MPAALALAVAATLGATQLGGAQLPRRDSIRPPRPSVLLRTRGDTDHVRRADAAAMVDIDSLDPAALAARITAATDTFVRAFGDPGGFRSRADSVASVRTRLAAERSDELRVVVSLNRRRLWVLIAADTLLSAPIAVSTDETLEYAGRKWTFETPRGVRTVLAKREKPVWTPPVWHYAEVAREHGLDLVELSSSKPLTLDDGRQIAIRNGEVGIIDPISRQWAALPTDEHVIFNGTLYVPPVGTKNRRVEGELGRHMLDTGNGFLMHGTPHRASIGTAATHGCIRLRDEDIEWLYEMIPVGTRVYIY